MKTEYSILQICIGVAAILIPACLVIMVRYKKKVFKSSGIDFTVDINSGELASNGGFLVVNSVMIARTNSGTFIAVAASCTHQGSTVNYHPDSNNFSCPSHQAHFDCNGKVIQGPASKSLKKYKTLVNGNSLRIFA